jgi:hypothetical protein
LALLLGWVFTQPLSAQESIWRCGHEYTNRPSVQQKATCQTVDWWPVTLGEGKTVWPAAGVVTQSAPSVKSPKRSATPEQQTRDAEARLILEAEWRQLEERRLALQQAYQAAASSPPKALQLKEQLARTEADMVALQRELRRFPPTSSSATASK